MSLQLVKTQPLHLRFGIFWWQYHFFYIFILNDHNCYRCPGPTDLFGHHTHATSNLTQVGPHVEGYQQFLSSSRLIHRISTLCSIYFMSQNNTCTMDSFQNSWWAHNSNVVKTYVALTWKIMTWPHHNFAHVTTAELQCHVQNYISLASLKLNQSKNNFHKT